MRKQTEENRMNWENVEGSGGSFTWFATALFAARRVSYTGVRTVSRIIPTIIKLAANT